MTGRHGISFGHPPMSALAIEKEDSRCRLPGVSSPSFAPVRSETQRHKTSPRSGSCGTHRRKRRAASCPHLIARQPDTPPVDVFAQGRSPGLRIITFIPVFPGLHDPVTRNGTDARRSQLRGQLRHCSALRQISPNSRLSPRSLRIEGTSNTRYSTRVYFYVNGWFRFRVPQAEKMNVMWITED